MRSSATVPSWRGSPPPGGHLFLTYKYTRNVELPGPVVHLLGGSGPLSGDAPFGDGSLLFASGAQGLLENLQPAHVRIGGVSKARPWQTWMSGWKWCGASAAGKA